MENQKDSSSITYGSHWIFERRKVGIVFHLFFFYQSAHALFFAEQKLHSSQSSVK